MKKGFTLAEVLITLAIIGVVAALTIPVVVHKYQQKAMYTQFMKEYNTIVNTINLSIAKNGSPETWILNENGEEATVKEYILPYLNVISECSSSDSGCGNYNITALTGEDLGGTFKDLTADFGGKFYTMADGSAFAVVVSEYSGGVGYIQFLFDTNGPKGPNTFGRDLFFVDYSRAETKVEPGKYVYKWTWLSSKYEKGGEESSNPGVLTESNCDPNTPGDDSSVGFGCPARLLQEGKMNY